MLSACRGAVAGRLVLYGHPDAPESAMDCSSFGSQGVPMTAIVDSRKLPAACWQMVPVAPQQYLKGYRRS